MYEWKEGAGKAVSSNLSVPASVSSDSCSVSDVRTKASKCQMHSLTPLFSPTKLLLPAGLSAWLGFVLAPWPRRRRA